VTGRTGVLLVDDDRLFAESVAARLGDDGRMDVLGIAYHDFSHEQRDHVCAHHPREANFKESIIDHFANGIIKKPLTTLGNVKADVLALKDMNYVRQNFCSIILGSAWPV